MVSGEVYQLYLAMISNYSNAAITVFLFLVCYLVPTAPINFMLSRILESSTTLSATWEEPDPANGMITGYTLRCTASSTTLELEYDVDVNDVMLENLIPFTEYQCTISANTSIGEGPASDMQTAMTDEGGKSTERTNHPKIG